MSSDFSLVTNAGILQLFSRLKLIHPQLAVRADFILARKFHISKSDKQPKERIKSPPYVFYFDNPLHPLVHQNTEAKICR